MQNISINQVQSDRTVPKEEIRLRSCKGIPVDTEGHQCFFVSDSSSSIFSSTTKLFSAMPPSTSASSIPVSIQSVSASITPSLFIAKSSGEVISFPLLVHSKTVSSSPSEVVAFIEDGISTMSWSPDGRIAIALTPSGRIATLTVVEKQEEREQEQEKEQEDILVSLIQEEKQRKFDIGSGNGISWRGDSEHFVLCSEGKLEIFSKNGKQETVCKKLSDVDGELISGIVSWRPCGDLIAVTAWVPQKHEYEVICFEEAGFVRAHCGKLSGKPLAITWNSTSDILATVSMVSQDPSRLCVQLWNVSNFVWQLKNSFRISISNEKKEEINNLGVDAEFDPEDPLLLRVVIGDFLWTFSLSICCCTSKDIFGTTAVINGKTISLTYLSNAVLPPPLCEHQIEFPSNVASVSLSSGETPFIAVQLETNELFVGSLNSMIRPELHSLGKLPFRLLQSHLISSDCVIGICCNDNSIQQQTNSNEPTIAIITFNPQQQQQQQQQQQFDVKLVLLPSKTPATISTSCSSNGSLFILQENLQPVLELQKNGTIEQKPLSKPPIGLIDFEVASIGPEKSMVVVGRTKNNVLYVGDFQIPGRCSSFGINSEFIIFTTLDNKLRFICRSIPITIESQETLEKGWRDCKRDIERGSTLVSILKYGVVLQIPRGNLELIYPRALILSAVRNYLKGKAYKTAFLEARRHRLDLNIICDYNLDEFLKETELFVKQVSNAEHLNTFMSSLKDEDVTETLYKTPQAIFNGSIAKSNQTSSSQITKSKVNKVCEALRSTFNKINPIKFLFCIITSFAVMKPPHSNEALLMIKSLYEKRDQSSEEALDYLCFLCDVDQLYNVALEMYDIDLVRLVAKKSQKDPKEWEPFLEQLEKLPLILRCHSIDVYLHKYSSALKHLSQAGKERFEDCLALMERHELYKDAMEIFENDKTKLFEVMRRYGKYLSTVKGRHEQAGILFETCGEHSLAAEEFLETLSWKQAISSKSHDPTSTDESIIAFAKEIGERLLNNESFKDAAEVFSNYAKSRDLALIALINGRLWIDAWIFAQKNVEERKKIGTAILNEHLQRYISMSSEMSSELEKFIPTLKSLIETSSSSLAPPQQPQQQKQQDDDTISISTTTSTATSSSMNRRRAIRQNKPDAKTMAFRTLLSLLPSEPLQEEIGSALRILVQLGNISEAKTIQHVFVDVVQKAKEAIIIARKLITVATQQQSSSTGGLNCAERARIDSWAEGDCTTNAMVYSLKGNSLTSSVVLLLEPFGLLSGGRIDVNITAKRVIGDSPFAFLICTYQEAMSVEVDSKDPTTCLPESIKCMYSVGFNTTLSQSFAISEYDLFYLCVISCPNETITAFSSFYDITASLTLLNPDSEQLTCGLLPYPVLFGCFFCCWVIVLILWLISLLTSFRRSTKLHWALTVFPLLKITSTILSAVWWRVVSSIGRNPSGAIAVTYWIFLVLSEVGFFLIVMILGAGIGISSNSLKRDSPTIILISIFLGCATVFDSTLRDDSITQLTVWLAHVLLRITAVLYSFVLVNRNIQEVEAHAAIEGNGFPLPPPDSPLHVFTERRRILVSYKQLIVAWLIADLSIYFALLVFVKDWVWVPDLLYECIAVIFFLCLGIVLRNRSSPIITAEVNNVAERVEGVINNNVGDNSNDHQQHRFLHNPQIQQRVALLLQQRQQNQQAHRQESEPLHH